MFSALKNIFRSKYHLSHFPHHLSPNGFSLVVKPVKSNVWGFSLVELLVVIAIIGILTGGAIAAYGNFNQAQTVRRVALEMKSNLRETQNKAVAGVKHVDCKVDDFDRDDPPVSNPDNIDDFKLNGHYIIFDIPTDNGRYVRQMECEEATESGQDWTFPPDTIIQRPDPAETFTLPSSVTIGPIELRDASDSDCTAVTNPLDELLINFTPPPTVGVEFYEAVLIGTNLRDCIKAAITITDGQTSFEIIIDKAGQITEKKL